MSWTPQNYKTKAQMLDLRKTLDNKYTYNLRIGKLPQKVYSPKKQAINALPGLTINDDINSMIREADEIYRVRSPRPIHKHFFEDIRNSEKRIMRVRCGQPINHVFTGKQKQYDLEEIPKSEKLSEKESITPSKEYVVPQLEPKLGFYNKNEEKITPLSAREENRLQGIIFRINEQDRQINNQILEDINRRNSRREKSMRLQYSTYLKKGMRAAQREAKRNEALSVLKTKREEKWWPDFIESYKTECNSPEELNVLKELVNVKFDELGLMQFLKICEEMNWPPWLYKQILHQANDAGHFMNPVQLGTILNPPKGQRDLNPALISTVSVLSTMNIELDSINS